MMFDDLRICNFDGQAILQRVIEMSSYRSLEQAVAALAAFAHPGTVAQAHSQNIFRIVRTRAMEERGKFSGLSGTGAVMFDDNKGPTDAFVWAHGISRSQYRDVQFNHIWGDTLDVSLYTNLANICVLPAFLSKLTDSHRHIQALLRYHSFALYRGWKPTAQPEPAKPSGYDELVWADPLPAVQDLEASYRGAMRTKPKDRTTVGARELGWIFSNYQPDKTV
jgi:hypothetical protein